MKAEIGDKLIRHTRFGYYTLIATARVLNGSHNLRHYESEVVERILQLADEITWREKEQRELYESLEKVE